MKLYYVPSSSSLYAHIVLREGGFDFELEKVDLATKKTTNGADLKSVNPKGCVPTLVLDGGEVLTEGMAIVQLLADQKPGANLAPQAGTVERHRLNEWLSFLSSELDRGMQPLFIYPDLSDENRAKVIARVETRLDYLDDQLKDKAYLWGDTFTIADAYCFTILNWTNFLGIDLGRWPNAKQYFDGIAARPKVQETLQVEASA